MYWRPLALALAAIVLLSAALSSAAPLLVFGHVVDWEGRPVRGAKVDVFSGETLVKSTVTDEKGFFGVYLEPGSYTFRVYKKGYSVATKSVILTRETAGSIGSIVLDKGLFVLPETSKVEAKQGESVRIPVTLKNRGLEPLSVSINVAVPSGWKGYVETEGGLKVKNIILKPLENMTVTLVVTVSRGALGMDKVKMILSWVNFTDTTEFTFIVSERKWYFIETPYRVVRVYAGESVRLPLTLKNTLPDEEVFNVSSQGPPRWPTFVVDERGVIVDALLLKPGETRNLTLVTYVPENARGNQTYRAVVTATAGSAVSRVELFFNVKAGYDILKISLKKESFDGVAGGNVTIPFELSNIGARAVTAFLEARCSVPGVVLFFVDDKGNVVREVAAEPSRKTALMLVARIPASVQPGSFTVNIRARGEHSNATGVATIYVHGRKDFEILNTNFGFPAVQGSTATYVIYIKNTGSVRINSLAVRLGRVPAGITARVTLSRTALNPGEEARAEVKVNVSEQIVEGVYNIPFVVVGDEVVKYRVIVVSVQSRAGQGYVVFASIIMAVSVAVALYNNWRRGSGDARRPRPAANIRAGG